MGTRQVQFPRLSRFRLRRFRVENVTQSFSIVPSTGRSPLKGMKADNLAPFFPLASRKNGYLPPSSSHINSTAIATRLTKPRNRQPNRSRRRQIFRASPFEGKASASCRKQDHEQRIQRYQNSCPVIDQKKVAPSIYDFGL